MRKMASVPSSTSTGNVAQIVESSQLPSGSYPCAHGVAGKVPVQARTTRATITSAIRSVARSPPRSGAEGAGLSGDEGGTAATAMQHLERQALNDDEDGNASQARSDSIGESIANQANRAKPPTFYWASSPAQPAYRESQTEPRTRAGSSPPIPSAGRTTPSARRALP